LVLLVTLVGLGRESLWLDEAYSVAAAKLPIGAFVDLVASREANMAPYYVLLRAWLVFGDGESAVRSLSIIAAVASVPMGVVLARRLLGAKAAVVAAALLSVNAFFIEYAQEARGYSLVLFLSIAATHLFVVAVDDRSVRAWVGYVVIGCLGIYVHFFAAFVLLAHLLSLLALDAVDRPRRKNVALAYGGLLLLVSPLVLFVLTTENQRTWIPAVSPTVVARALAKLSGGRSIAGGVALIAGYAILSWPVVARSWVAWRSGHRSRQVWADALILAWIVVPVALSASISVAKPIFVDRYLLVVLPAMALTAAGGFRAATSRRAAAAVLSALLLVSMTQVVALYAVRDHEDWRAATAFVLERAREGDGVAFFRPFGKLPWSYYVDRLPDVSTDVTPEPILPIFDWRTGDLSNPRTLDPAGLSQVDDRYDRVWLIVSQAPELQESRVSRALRTTFELEGSTTFAGITVLLYERR
jgi:mannosyltransferase